MTDKRYDPDSPPEEMAFSTDGFLLDSFYISSVEEAEAIDPLLAERYDRFVEDFRKDTGLTDVECWVLQVEVANTTWEETGSPLITSQLVRVVDKKGNPLRAGQAPSLLASQFRKVTAENGEELSASPLAKGEKNSLVGRRDVCIHFEETEVPVGRGYTKRFRLWPVAVLTDLQVKAIAPRTVSARSDEETITEASRNGKVDESMAITTLVSVLNGKTPDEMLGAILGNNTLSNVDTVLGVSLIEAATNESLAKLLVAKGLMKDEDGVLVAS
jgi:hypothetical protein